MSMPVETRGNCNACGKRTLLGDGLCKECWDASIPENTYEYKTDFGVIKLRNITLKKLNDRGYSYRQIGAMYLLRPNTVKKIILNLRRNNGDKDGKKL